MSAGTTSLGVGFPVSRKRIKRLGKRLPGRIAAMLGLDPFSGGRSLRSLNETQTRFVQWNAERLGIPLEEARVRYLDSWKSVRGGHRRQAYNRFCEASHEIFRVFHEDSEDEVFEAYRFHAKMHFLRMLSRKEPVWADSDPLVRSFEGREEVRILDYGCGLAQASRGLASKLRSRGMRVELTLADIPTLRKAFLVWLCERSDIRASFLDCTEASPVPPLPRVDVAFANDVFEHLHDPRPVLDAILARLEPGGFLVTDLGDHYAGFMHVSPDLTALTERLHSLGYEVVRRHRTYRKPS